MTLTVVVLTLAYVGVAALLLNLSLGAAIRFGWSIKLGAIFAVTALYVAAWVGHNGLMGWPTSERMPEDFRLHWVTVNEPDKVTGADGSIFFWVRELDEAGLPQGDPRAYRVPWDEETAEAAEAALELLQGGKPLNGRMSRQAIDPDADMTPEEGTDYAGDDGASGIGARPRFKFVRVIPPALPAKPVPQG